MPFWKQTKPPVIMREYKGMGNAPRKAFEKDAQRLAKDGYRVTNEVWQRQTLMGVHLGTGVLLVTYQLSA